MKSMRMIWALVATLVAFGCSGADPEEELALASEAVDVARSKVEQARAAVQEREKEVEAAQKRLADARAELREAQTEVAKREETVDLNATDDVLFRAVQKRLLDDDELKNVAIAATVKNGVVTLSGGVPSGELRDRAVTVAGETPGVARVASNIAVAVSAEKSKPE